MLVVTGPHRSGTSSVAMIMEHLGIDFGSHEAFYGADEWNERGYFERRDVIDLNSRILTGFPRTQQKSAALLSQVRYLTFPSRDGVRRRSERLSHEVRQLSHALGDMAVKDPRFCLTHPAWEPYIQKMVVCLRHPTSVARSLHRRQRIPLRLGLRFWEYHAEGLVTRSPAQTVYVDFDALSDTHTASSELVRLVAFLNLDLTESQIMDRFRERFEPHLRHFAADHDSDLPDSTRRLWKELQKRRRA